MSKIAHNAIDYSGKHFNMLTVVERISNYNNTGNTYYRCVCDCGKECFINKNSVKKETAFSCGCTKKKQQAPNRKNHVGEKYGKLTIIEMLYGYNDEKSTYCKCKCDCGNTTIANCSNIIKGATQSCGCYETESRYNRKNHEKDLLGMTFGHLTVISLTNKRYANGNVGWLCKCDCGNEIIVRSGNLLRGKTRSCGCNKTSKYEEYIEQLLNNNNIEYIREYRFIDCRNTFPLPFDFYLPLTNTCIECQGQQHYISVEHFGGEKRFERQQQNDDIKKKYCLKNNINLICLPYDMTKEEINIKLQNILNPVTTTAI